MATSGLLTALESTKFVVGWGSTLDPAGGAYSASQPSGWFKGVLLLRVREDKGREGDVSGGGREENRRERKKRDERR